MTRDLLELLQHAVALQFREVIDKKLAVQMVDLMLDDSRGETIHFAFLDLVAKRQKANPNTRGPRYDLVVVRDRQAAFLIIAEFVGRPDYFRIDEHERLLFVIAACCIHRHDAFRQPNLHCRETNTGSVIHRREHVIDKRLYRAVDLVDRRRGHAQEGIG